MLTNQWQDASFRIASLEDRKPITPEDELVVIACPDPFAATDCQRVVRSLAEQDDQAGGLPRPVVLFNQRLSR